MPSLTHNKQRSQYAEIDTIACAVCTRAPLTRIRLESDQVPPTPPIEFSLIYTTSVVCVRFKGYLLL